MTMRLQDGGDPLWGPFVYDGDETENLNQFQKEVAMQKESIEPLFTCGTYTGNGSVINEERDHLMREMLTMGSGGMIVTKKKDAHVTHPLTIEEFVMQEPDDESTFSKDLRECLEMTKQAYARAVEICRSNGYPMYEFTVDETGATWVGPMPEGTPIECKVTVGIPATEQLVKVGDDWVIQPASKENPNG